MPMDSISIKYIVRGGVVAATLLCGISSVFADDTNSRLQAYKANRLIPQEFTLENSDSDTDVVFSASSLSWNTVFGARQEKINSLGQAFAGMTASEVLAQIPNLDNGQDALDYLAAIFGLSRADALCPAHLQSRVIALKMGVPPRNLPCTHWGCNMGIQTRALLRDICRIGSIPHMPECLL